MPGASLIRRDVAVIGGGFPELAEAISSRYAKSVYVRYGSLADITARSRHIRFTPDSGHSAVQLECPKSVISGHALFDLSGLVRLSHNQSR